MCSDGWRIAVLWNLTFDQLPALRVGRLKGVVALPYIVNSSSEFGYNKLMLDQVNTETGKAIISALNPKYYWHTQAGVRYRSYILCRCLDGVRDAMDSMHYVKFEGSCSRNWLQSFVVI
jgi:hypothetical protein